MPFQRRHIGGFDLPSFFRNIQRGKTIIRYPKETVIYTQGDSSDAVFFLQSGQVKLTVCSPTGREAIIGLLRAGDFVGEGCLVGQNVRISTATAITDTTAIRVEKAVMANLLRSEPKFSEYFLSYLLMRNISFQEDVISLAFNSTEKRLARALLLLARVREGQRLPAVIPRVTHETPAQMIGATRAQVSALMSKFRKKGYIHYDDELRVNESLVDFVLNEERRPSHDRSAEDPPDKEPRPPDVIYENPTGGEHSNL